MAIGNESWCDQLAVIASRSWLAGQEERALHLARVAAYGDEAEAKRQVYADAYAATAAHRLGLDEARAARSAQEAIATCVVVMVREALHDVERLTDHHVRTGWCSSGASATPSRRCLRRTAASPVST